jgi:GTPase SAR1 family protein
MNEYEEARTKLEKLTDWYRDKEGKRNEATTRLQLIDTLFFEVLGWSKKDDVVLEEAHGGKYADYTFITPRRILIVEAKKEGEYFEIAMGNERIEYSLSTLMRDNKNLHSAVHQATEYCQSRGVPYGVVSNGHQLVCFLASRSDGTPPYEGKAIVFNSLQHMVEQFASLWKALSKLCMEKKRLYELLVGEPMAKIPMKLSGSILNYPGLKGRNVFQTDLQILSELVIEDISHSRDLEAVFLKECYCHTGALSQHSLASKTILQARYAELFESTSPAPTTIPIEERDGLSDDFSVQSFSKRPILLLGDVGVGKTMFIRHLRQVYAEDIFSNAMTFYIDLGSQATLTTDIAEVIADEIATQLLKEYSIDIFERNFVRAVYYEDLNRFGKGIYEDIKNSQPDVFKQKEIEYLAEKLTHKDRHLKFSLHHLSRGRKKQIIIFLDNADQRGEEIQSHSFLIAQELAEHWPVSVFLSLRPETFHRSIKEGALSGYHPKAFTISPPRIDIVLQKRLEFALKLTSGQIQIKSLPVGSLVFLPSLEGIINVFLNSIKNNNSLIEFLENVSGGNVRLALDLVRQFFGSGHVDTKKIVGIYNQQGSYLIPLHEFERAVFYGDFEHYNPEASPICNIFDLSWPDPRDHFTLPILLGILASGATLNLAESGFIETAILYEQMQSIGFTPDQIDSALLRAVRTKLIETSGRKVLLSVQAIPKSVRITTVGTYHLVRLSRQFTYLDAITVDTPILEESFRSKIGDVREINFRLDRARIMCSYLSSMWQKANIRASGFDWMSTNKDLLAKIDEVAMKVSK